MLAAVTSQAGGLQRMLLRGHTAPLTALLLSPTGTDLVTGSACGELRVWCLDIGDWRGCRHPPCLRSLAFGRSVARWSLCPQLAPGFSPALSRHTSTAGSTTLVRDLLWSHAADRCDAPFVSFSEDTCTWGEGKRS